MPRITRHLIDRGDGATVELIQAQPANPVPKGALLFVHGNQGGSLIGASEAADSGMLARFSSRLDITAAAVSQPGFGASDGPPDFCGPKTQQAIIAALSFLRQQPTVDPHRIVLYGHSRGAVASAMAAAQVDDLRAIILSGGVYDLKAAFDTAWPGLRQAIEREAGLSEDAFRARSALHHARKFQAETLLLHGRHDDRASVAQAEMFSEALSDAGVPVELRIFDCGHNIPSDHSRDVLRSFLGQVFNPAVTLH